VAACREKPATGTKAPSLAGECNEVFVAAAVALNAQEAVFEQPALEVVLELPAHECRDMSAIGIESG
jgi:hypothetical protein